MNQVTIQNGALDPKIIESLVIGGDLKRLTPAQKVAYYKYRCDQLGLDPAAQPFALLSLNGKEVLYALSGCTQQLCDKRGLSVAITKREKIDDIYCVEARVTGKDGRSTENMGTAPVGGLKGEALGNAFLKATTKAIRRTVLAHCGVGAMDETEVETIPDARPQGRGSWRHEYASMYSELQACGDDETAIAWWDSPETQDFVKRAGEHHEAKGGVDYGSLLENEYLTLLPKLKQVQRIEQDGGNEPVKAPAAASPEAEMQASPPESSPSDVLALGETASRILDMIDIAETAEDMKAVAASSTNAKNNGELTEEEAAMIQRAYKSRAKKIKERAA